MFYSVALPLQDYVRILEVDLKKELRFYRHLKHVAYQNSFRICPTQSSVFRLLYKVQVRPYLEYGALTWMSSPATHLQRLDKMERRAQRQLENIHQPHDMTPLDTLEHHR